jgi:hypothetical protein
MMDCVGNHLFALHASIQKSLVMADDCYALHRNLKFALSDIYVHGAAKSKSTGPLGDDCEQSTYMNEPKKKKEQVRGGYNHGCAFVGCNKNASMPGIVMKRVPSVPKEPKHGAKKDSYICYHKRVCAQNELIHWLGMGQQPSLKDPHFCN